MRISKTKALAAGVAAAAGAWAARTWLRNRKNRGLARGRQIVVLGAGFAGMTVADELSKLLPAEDGPEICLVDRNNFLLFTPMLTEVAGGELDARHIVAAPRRLSSNVTFIQGDAQSIDLASRKLVLNTGMDGEGRTREMTPDHIVIALGSAPNYHHIPGVEEHSFAMKSVHDAAELRARVLRSIEAADAEEDEAKRRELLTFVVGGGGYTGVETMAAINDLARATVKEDHPRLRAEDVKTVIVEPGGRLLKELSPELAAFAQEKLEEHGVEVVLKSKIASASEAAVELEGGRQIPTRTFIWAGGIKPNPLVGNLDCERGHHGGIVVDRSLAVPGRPGVWALGDCAEVPDPKSHGDYAPTAQNATREGELVARNIVASLKGEPSRPFTFEPIGEVALVGRHTGVARLYGHAFSGFLAWAMWRAIYLSKMPGMAQRSRIALDWLLDAIFGRNPAEAPLRG